VKGCVDDREMEGKELKMGVVGALWGITGISLLLGSAIYRLTLVALAAFSLNFFWYHWATLVLVVVIMAHSEGYRGFQKGFSPRVAARAKHLVAQPNLVHTLLAPLFCMGYFHATRRRMITSISVTIGIILLIVGVRLLPQPWRGIIDAGVVVGLVWGLVSVLIFSVLAWTSDQFHYSPDLPE
jgi:hypothetical protein